MPLNKSGHVWNQDDWFVILLNQLNEGSGYGRSRNKDLNELEIFMAKAIIDGLRYWQDPIEVTPTDEAGEGSERSEEPPGEPTPIAQPAVPQEAVQPQGASSSRVDAERPQYYRMDIGQEVPQNAGEADLGDRTGVRVERDARDVGDQQGNLTRSRAESYHSARSALRDERMTALEQQVSRLCQALEMRGPPPQERPEQGDVNYSRVPSASGSVRAHPYRPPTSKAPHVQVGRPISDTQIPRAKSHENPEQSGVYRTARLSPAYQTPEEGIWDQSYLSKALQQMKDSEIVNLNSRRIAVSLWSMRNG